MIYVIAALAVWLLLVLAFAALVGWSFAQSRAAAGDEALVRERENLVRDIVALAAGESGAANDGPGAERDVDVARRMGEIHIARIAELERQLSAARANADSAAAQAAELQRALDVRDSAPEPALLVDLDPVEEKPSIDEEAVALQAWRLRYFEQRVRYLEGAPREPEKTPALAALDVAPPVDDWRARVSNAEAAYLAGELRALARAAPESAPQIEDAAEDAAEPENESASPFAANADVDVLLRWRMLYLERRVAHLQSQVNAEPAPAPVEVAELHPEGPDADRWKWRARYLEARTRHLEQRLIDRPVALAAAPAVAPEQEAASEPPQAAPVRRSKPLMLASARHGAPDDLTLIEGVSLLQQTTLYSLGVFHFDQIAAWSDENVAWVDQYLRLRGRIEEEEWVEQAGDLAREGPVAARRVYEAEDA